MRRPIVLLAFVAALGACSESGPGAGGGYLARCDFSRIAPASAEVTAPPVVTGPAEDAAGLYNRYSYEARIRLSPGTSIEAYLGELVKNVDEDLKGLGFQTETTSNEPNVHFVKYRSGSLSGVVFAMAKPVQGAEYDLTFRINENPT